jgi:NAD(P)H-nitrite reductase large subunit
MSALRPSLPASGMQVCTLIFFYRTIGFIYLCKKKTIHMNTPFEDHEIICRHLRLTKADLIKVIREKGLRSFTEIQDETDAGTICGTCVADIEEILEAELARQNGSNTH